MPKYKHGKIETPFGLDILKKLMDRAAEVDRSGYSIDFIQALLATYYWYPFRRSEVIGDTQRRKWHVAKRDATGQIVRGESVLRIGEKWPGIMRENGWVENGFLYIYQPARKHGERIEPVARSVDLPYMNLVVQQWQKTLPGKRVFPIDDVVLWRIWKRIDPKLYSHMFVFNRITKQSRDPRTSMADIVQETGKDPKTVAWYMARSGRNAREIGERLKNEQ